MNSTLQVSTLRKVNYLLQERPKKCQIQNRCVMKVALYQFDFPTSIPYINNVYITFTFMHIKFYYYFEVTCAKVDRQTWYLSLPSSVCMRFYILTLYNREYPRERPTHHELPNLERTSSSYTSSTSQLASTFGFWCCHLLVLWLFPGHPKYNNFGMGQDLDGTYSRAGQSIQP
jgi:hypothetical protein